MKFLSNDFGGRSREMIGNRRRWTRIEQSFSRFFSTTVTDLESDPTNGVRELDRFNPIK